MALEEELKSLVEPELVFMTNSEITTEDIERTTRKYGYYAIGRIGDSVFIKVSDEKYE